MNYIDLYIRVFRLQPHSVRSVNIVLNVFEN